MSDSACKGCGGPLPPKKRPQGRRLWCSEACRVKNYRRTAGAWVRGEIRTCRHCGSEFEPKQERQLSCSYQCGYLYRDSLKPRCPEWAAGRRVVREIPCMDCGAPVLSRANRQSCPDCKAQRNRSTNRRKNAKRKGAPVGVRYTLTELGERDGWSCHLCTEPVDKTLPGTAAQGPTVDHLVPLSKGGTDEFDNVALAHRACNIRRRDADLDEYRLAG